jgi:HK97 family phage major capsid protein
LFRHGDQNRLPLEFRKSLTAFSLGANGVILAPQISDQVLSCLVDPSDVTGIVNNVTISGGSIKFLIDNVRMGDAAWACEASCFANNPQPASECSPSAASQR